MKTAVLVASLLLLVAGVFGNYLRFAEQMPEHGPDFDMIPMEWNGYQAEERRFGEWSYEILQADTTTLRVYRGPGDNDVWLFVAYFVSQKYGSQIHSPKHCLPGSGWQIRSQEPFELQLPDGRSKSINRMIIAEGSQRELMFYWYETRGGAVRDEFALKLDLAVNSLLFRPTDAAFVRLTIPAADTDIEAATAEAVALLQALHPDIMKALPFSD